jgi:haloalkane dehalogenase
MPISTYGEKARAAAGLTVIDRIPGKHFPQEDQAPAIATRVASIAIS